MSHPGTFSDRTRSYTSSLKVLDSVYQLVVWTVRKKKGSLEFFFIHHLKTSFLFFGHVKLVSTQVWSVYRCGTGNGGTIRAVLVIFAILPKKQYGSSIVTAAVVLVILVKPAASQS